MIFAFMYNLPLEIILLGCVLQGTGTGMFSAPNNKYVLTIVDKKDLTDASSLLSTSKEFGKILSTSIFAVILSLLIGNQELGPVYLDELLFSIHIMMLICAILALSGAILLFYGKYRYKFETNPEIMVLINKLTPERFKKKH